MERYKKKKNDGTFFQQEQRSGPPNLPQVLTVTFSGQQTASMLPNLSGAKATGELQTLQTLQTLADLAGPPSAAAKARVCRV
jgi:hypothetical protein